MDSERLTNEVVLVIYSQLLPPVFVYVVVTFPTVGDNNRLFVNVPVNYVQ